MSTLAGSPEHPWVLTTPSGGSEFTAYRDEALDPRGVDQAPGVCPLPIEPQLGTQYVQAAAIDARRHRMRVAQKLANIETGVADQTLRVDG